MKLFFRLLVSIFAWILSACASVNPPPVITLQTAGETHTERRVERNYEIGKESVAYVGEAIIDRRVFELDTTTLTTTGLMAATDFMMVYPPFGYTTRVKAGTAIPIVGSTTRDGKQYRLVRLPGGIDVVGLLVDDSGAFEGSGINIPLRSRMGYSYRVDPPSTRLAKQAKTESAAHSISRNSITYLSGNSQEVRLRRQTFGSTSATRPISVDDVVHRLGGDPLVVDGFTIRIIRADEEKLRYVVVSEPKARPDVADKSEKFK